VRTMLLCPMSDPAACRKFALHMELGWCASSDMNRINVNNGRSAFLWPFCSLVH
jgi:hypothetical protein